MKFQPTRPLRGATETTRAQGAEEQISTHAPLAGRDDLQRRQPVPHMISTHAPLAGRDMVPPRVSKATT